MGPLEILRTTERALRRVDCRFAVAGGIAANLFRKEPRLTRDVDLLLLADAPIRSQEVAGRLLRDLGFRVGIARQADLKRSPMMGRKTSPVVMLVGRMEGRESEGGVDILLPGMLWVPQAVERAQHHVIDFGFAKLPTITVEDFIVSKAFALRDNPSRFKDMDDVQAVFESGNLLDLIYLVEQFERFRLSLPRELRRSAPSALRRVMRSRAKRS
ncbi:MAG: nucleotidyl transferase AbiEii/AbiGii toxin family protein [Pseudomonadota bacterium]